MPTHPALQPLLPLVIALYGEKTSLVCHHPSREVAFVPFTTGVSQGDGTGSLCSAVVEHFAAHQTLVRFPGANVRILAIMDDFQILGPMLLLGPVFQTLSDILRDCLGVSLNLSKSSLIVLQAASFVHLQASLSLVYPECPNLASLQVITEGFECAGTPVGYPCYVHSFWIRVWLLCSWNFRNCSHALIRMTFCSLFVTVAIQRSGTSLGILYSFTKPTQGDDQAVCPHHKGAGPLLAH